MDFHTVFIFLDFGNMDRLPLLQFLINRVSKAYHLRNIFIQLEVCVYVKALIAFDGTEGSKTALMFGISLRDVVDELIITYVFPSAVTAASPVEAYIPPSIVHEQDELSDSIISTAEEMLGSEKIKTSFLKLDASGEQVARVLVGAAVEKGADMIITGTRKLGGFSKMILGSVSSEILKQSPIPVIVVPPRAPETE